MAHPGASMDELPFMTIAPSALFAGRTCLYPHEVATALSCTVLHVRNLIEEGRLGAVDISGKKVRKGKHCAAAKRFWRIPVSAYQKFLEDNNSL